PVGLSCRPRNPSLLWAWQRGDERRRVARRRKCHFRRRRQNGPALGAARNLEFSANACARGAFCYSSQRRPTKPPRFVSRRVIGMLFAQGAHGEMSRAMHLLAVRLLTITSAWAAGVAEMPGGMH